MMPKRKAAEQGGQGLRSRSSVSSQDLEGVNPRLIFGPVLPAATASASASVSASASASAPAPSSSNSASVSSSAPGTAASGGRPAGTDDGDGPSRWPSYGTSQDLDDLHPHLMWGAVFASVRSIWSAFLLILPGLLSRQVVVQGLLVALAVRFLIPWEVLRGVFASAVVLAFLAELVFLFWILHVRHRLQQTRDLAQRIPPPGSSRETFEKTVEGIDMTARWYKSQVRGRSPEKWLEDWFLGTSFEKLRKDNVIDFFAWAFWTKWPSELTEDDWVEMNWMLEVVREKYGWTFPEGRDTGVRPIRVNFDPMNVWNHPLSYYVGLSVLRISSRHTMHLFGFTSRKCALTGLSYFHCPPTQHFGHHSCNGQQSQPKQSTPILLIHGLGVGMAPYLRFVRRLMATSRELIILELPEISQSCSSEVLAPQAMVKALEMILEERGHKKACIISHSYGTFVTSWFVRARPDMVESLVLMDPVCFMLSHSDVAFNFLYRRPTNVFSLFVAHFVRWELFTANVLMRHFHWYHNVLWAEEIPAKCIVALGGNDDIVDPVQVRRYLDEYGASHNLPGRELHVLYFDSFHHGEVLLSKTAQLQILDLL